MNQSSRLKLALRGTLKKLPGEGRPLFEAYWRLKIFRKQVRDKLTSARMQDLPDPEAVYWIDPARIELHTDYQPGTSTLPLEDRVFHPTRDQGCVFGGSWDLSSHRFGELEVARAIEQRVELGIEWQETEFYSTLLSQIRTHGTTHWEITSKDDLDARCRYLDRLIDSIRRQGFLQNYEIDFDGGNGKLDRHPRYSAEVTVNIGRDGRYLFQHGRHRLAIAKALKISTIPVKVLVRHEKWVAFRESLRAFDLYQNPIHPDLQDLPFAHGCEDRFEKIKMHLAEPGGSVLDVGANLGYFCHKLEDLGFECFAVETKPATAAIADRIRIAEGKSFKIITNDIFSAMRQAPLQRTYRVVLALSILHHFLKDADTFKSLQQWLQMLDVEQMFFEPHCQNESQMVGAHANFDESEFVQFILQNSTLRHSELIHRCDDGRPVFRLWR